MVYHAKDDPAIGSAFGNKNVVALIERWLEQARRGAISYAAICMAEDNGKIVFDLGGSIKMEEHVLEVVTFMKEEVQKSVERREAPPVNPTLGADYVCFNAARLPLSYDVIPILMNAEMDRVRSGAPGPLKVAFWMGFSGKLGLETEYRREMFPNVVRPFAKMLGAVETEDALPGRPCQAKASYETLVDRVRAGEKPPWPVPPLEALEWAAQRYKAPMITITLREAEHWPHRNSNVEAWVRFARDMERSCRVIFVRDTAKAYESLEQFETCPRASIDLGRRIALYERAECNFFVSNGPGTLASFGTRPLRQFIPLAPSSEFIPETALWWRERMHMEPGEQYPWATFDQRLIWGADTYENICQSWGR